MKRAPWAVAAGLGFSCLLLALPSCRTLPDPETIPTVPHSAADEVAESSPPEPVTVEPPLEPAIPVAPEIRRIVERPTSILVRVGLLTDQDRVDLGCCGSLRAGWEGQTVGRGSSITVTADPGRASAPELRLQVAALRDERQAEAMVERLHRLTGFGGETNLDAESGLHKVRVGPFADRSQAEAARRELSTHGVEEAWIVSEGGRLEDPALLVRSSTGVVRRAGRWLAVESEGEPGVRVGGVRYRGRILLYLNDRGRLNVIDELPIEEYLRGVVPKELGPDLYPQLEALKAQTVAARTYTVRNLGEFSEEGFDICATPRCQVYGGMEVEHPLTDRAIRETADEVLLWSDEPIDALYSATCGGHTEDVGTVFPLKVDEIYLKGVPCLEAGKVTLGGPVGETALPFAALESLLPGGGPTTRRLEGRLGVLAELAGLDPPGRATEGPVVLEDRSRTAIGTYWLALGGRVADLPFPDRVTTLAPESESDFLWRLASRLGVVRSEAVSFSAVEDGELLARRRNGVDVVWSLSERMVTGRRLESGDARAELTLAPGDGIEVVLRGDEVVGVVQTATRPRAVFDRQSRWVQWQRFRSDRQLGRSVKARLPGFDLATFEPLERGVSGRVGRLRLTAIDGRQEVVEGLAVRWTLDLPDTNFTARRHQPAGREAGWLFSGRGWGHGVGMCQIGAYGMAQRGNDYQGILSHYYAGVQLGRVSAVVRRVEQEAGSRSASGRR